MPKIILDVKLFDVNEVSQLLGVRQETLRKYTREGRIEGTVIGGKIYYSEDNIRQFLNRS